MMHVIQNSKTLQFIKEDGTWTKLKDEAMKFASTMEALDHWNKNHHTVVSFPPHSEAIEIP
jgi:hypothetical protein